MHRDSSHGILNIPIDVVRGYVPCGSHAQAHHNSGDHILTQKSLSIPRSADRS